MAFLKFKWHNQKQEFGGSGISKFHNFAHDSAFCSWDKTHQNIVRKMSKNCKVAAVPLADLWFKWVKYYQWLKAFKSHKYMQETEIARCYRQGCKYWNEVINKWNNHHSERCRIGLSPSQFTTANCQTCGGLAVTIGRF